MKFYKNSALLALLGSSLIIAGCGDSSSATTTGGGGDSTDLDEGSSEPVALSAALGVDADVLESGGASDWVVAEGGVDEYSIEVEGTTEAGRSWVRVTFPSAGTVSYAYQVSGLGSMEVEDDRANVATHSVRNSWTVNEFELGAGSSVVEWAFLGDEGEIGKLDNVTFSPTIPTDTDLGSVDLDLIGFTRTQSLDLDQSSVYFLAVELPIALKDSLNCNSGTVNKTVENGVTTVTFDQCVLFDANTFNGTISSEEVTYSGALPGFADGYSVNASFTQKSGDTLVEDWDAEYTVFENGDDYYIESPWFNVLTDTLSGQVEVSDFKRQLIANEVTMSGIAYFEDNDGRKVPVDFDTVAPIVYQADEGAQSFEFVFASNDTNDDSEATIELLNGTDLLITRSYGDDDTINY